MFRSIPLATTSFSPIDQASAQHARMLRGTFPNAFAQVGPNPCCDRDSRMNILLIIAAASGLFVVLALVAIGLLLFRIGGKKRVVQSPTTNMTIDLEALPLPPLPGEAATLDIYSSPSQLAVLVLAPVGRGHDLPDQADWRPLLEQLCPGFTEILDQHQPVFRKWPAQISHAGFYRSFFANMRNQDSPTSTTQWYKLAGRLDWLNRQILVGIVAKSNQGTPLAPIQVEQSGKWREILKKGTPS